VADPPAIKAKMLELTPDRATKLLERNTHNRSISGSRVEQYAADIKAGNWQLNGEAIKIADDGQILDGQHRLWAVIEAEAPIQTLLITGLPNETQETMDQGRPRSVADVLKLRGEKNYMCLAATTKIVAFYLRDGLPYQDAFKPGITVHHALRTLQRNEEIRDSVQKAQDLGKPWLSQSALAALHFLFATVDQVDADDFVVKLMRGEQLTAADPIWVLRERLIKAHGDKLNPIHPRVKLAFVIRTWNAYRTNEHIVRLLWKGGSSPDHFPRIDGLELPDHLQGEPENVVEISGGGSPPAALPPTSSALSASAASA
jgi:hypothetical protein